MKDIGFYYSKTRVHAGKTALEDPPKSRTGGTQNPGGSGAQTSIAPLRPPESYMSDEELFVATPELSVTIPPAQPATASHRMASTASYQVSPPKQFNFNHPEEWPKWARRFERFRKASGLTDKDEEAQVNTLIYTMGDDADDILRSFRLSEADSKNYDSVVSAFDSHFVKRPNVIYERAKFNQRRQEPGEPVDAFITALYGLAEHCGYASLHEEMIRDRIVVGLLDAKLSEKLQLDPELTLSKAVTQVRQAEAIKQQQALLRGETPSMCMGARNPDTHVGAVQGSVQGCQGGEDTQSRRRQFVLGRCNRDWRQVYGDPVVSDPISQWQANAV